MDAAGDFLSTPGRQRASLRETAHRPWPLPDGSWLMAQTWLELLFAHWRVPAERVRPLVPAGLSVDSYEGDAWLGVTPFRLTGLRLLATPPLPRLSTFLELNVRTYVTAEGKPGIWFFSLDASSAIGAGAARLAYKLPYFRARMSAAKTGEEIRYESRRLGAPPGRFTFRARYRPSGGIFTAAPGSLEHFLAERYCLYTADERGRLFRADIHHPPWPLQPAEAEIEANAMPPPELEGAALAPPGPGEPLLHFSHRQDTLIWPLRPLE